MKSKLNVLVVYSNHAYPIRATKEGHFFSFRRYSQNRCHYFNAGVRDVPAYTLRANFDLVIFRTTFLSSRWAPEMFAELRRKVDRLKGLDAVKIALPQDEFIYTDALSDFINEFQIDAVFSVAPESEWEKIYARVDRRKVKFYRVLTGYLDERTIQRINKLAGAVTDRPIDVGYRAWHAAPWLGRHGLLKVKIVHLFRAKAPAYEMNIDVSTDERDTLLGDDWFRFLLRCKYTIGVEGGASILDRDGAIKKRTEDYLAAHPHANFAEVEQACFPDVDGSLNLMAVSPRHLEACVTKTCQVLIEGDYNGLLRPHEHYLELKKDFSNIDCLLQTLKSDQLREGMTERAY